jgi:hypothetical protein
MEHLNQVLQQAEVAAAVEMGRIPLVLADHKVAKAETQQVQTKALKAVEQVGVEQAVEGMVPLKVEIVVGVIKVDQEEHSL